MISNTRVSGLSELLETRRVCSERRSVRCVWLECEYCAADWELHSDRPMLGNKRTDNITTTAPCWSWRKASNYHTTISLTRRRASPTISSFLRITQGCESIIWISVLSNTKLRLCRTAVLATATLKRTLKNLIWVSRGRCHCFVHKN